MPEYTNRQLNQIAGANYEVMTAYCTCLEEEGYWEQAREVLHHSVYEVRDLYLQSLLVQAAVVTKRRREEETAFILNLTKHDMLGIGSCADGVFGNTVAESAEKFLLAPPILLQLFCLRDKEKQTGITGLFFDACLNILLAMSYLNGVRDTTMSKYIGGYYDRVSAFLTNDSDRAKSVDAKYIFKKLCAGNLEDASRRLLEAGEDFAAFKKKHYYYREEGHLSKEEPAFFFEREKESAKHMEKAGKTGPAKLSERLQSEEVSKEAAPEIHKEELEKLLEELEGLIGLSEVKTEIRSLVNLIRVKKLREQYRLPQMDMSYHMVFTGNPGTGKTTVARLVAKIYKELGIVSKGTLTETDRAGLVAGYVGQTALKVKEVVDRSLGGVLFIDEAYTLSNSGAGNDFGGEAIDTLVKLMEDHRDDLVLIVAGYTEEMQQFLSANTGLLSRFNKFITFQDYTKEELLAILDSMADKAGFFLEEAAKEAVKAQLTAMTAAEQKKFGNARGIRNLFETIVMNQANRVVQYEEPTKEQLTKITAEDVGVLHHV